MLSLIRLAKGQAIRSLITCAEEAKQVLADLRVEHEVIVTHLVKFLLQQLLHFVEHLNRLVLKDWHHVREYSLKLAGPGHHYEYILGNLPHFFVFAHDTSSAAKELLDKTVTICFKKCDELLFCDKLFDDGIAHFQATLVFACDWVAHGLQDQREPIVGEVSLYPNQIFEQNFQRIEDTT